MIFNKKYKIKDLYVGRVGRITEDEFFVGKTFWDGGVNRKVEYNGPIGIFKLKDNIATRISTEVNYEYCREVTSISPQKDVWFIHKISPLTHFFSFKDGVTSLTKEKITKLEKIITEKKEVAKQKEETREK